MKNNGLFICLGLLLLGICLYCGITNFRDGDRVVSVRGLCEREVPADKVLWPLVYTLTGNDLLSINNKLESNNAIILEMLQKEGIPQNDITVNSAAITDLDANIYVRNERNFRYLATQVITVSSEMVEKVIELQKNQNSLLSYGITLSTDSYQYPTEFLFTRLNDIKPEMIEAATKAARESAEEFAEDSGSKVGQIRTATQGQFSIENRDRYTPQIKRIRVVTYLNYELN